MNLFKIFGEIALTGQAAVNSGLAGVNTNAAGTASKLATLGASVAAVGTSMSTWVTGPIVAVGGAMLALTTKIGNTADRLLDLKAITGLSTQAIQEWQYAAKIAGTDTEAVTNAMRMFNAQLDSIEKGTGPVSDAFKKLGIETKSFIAMTPDQQMSAMVTALQKLPDPAERARLGVELFSRQWVQLAPIVDLGAAALDKVRAAGASYAMDTSALTAANNFRISMAELKAQFDFVVQSLSISLLPAMTTLVSIFRDTGLPVIKEFGAALTQMATWFGQMPESVQTLIVGITIFAAALGPALLIIGKFAVAISAISGVFGGTAVAAGTTAAAVGGVGAAAGTAGVAATGMGVTLAGLGAALGAVLIVVGLVAAAIAAGIYVYKNWDSIVENLGYAWDAFLMTLDDVYNAIGEFGSNCSQIWEDLKTDTVATVASMGTLVMETVMGMVNDVIGAITSMYEAVVGHSIIPDMVAKVGYEMASMATDGAKQASNFAKNVTAGMASADMGMAYAGGGYGFSSGGGKMSGASSGGNSNVTNNYDYRGSIINDKEGMQKRMNRGGAGLQGR